MGFTSYDDLISEVTAGKFLEWDFLKSGAAAQAAGQWESLWYQNGSPGAGDNPAGTPGTAYTNSAGSMNWSNTSPDTKHILTFGGCTTHNMTLKIYDRLVAVSGIALSSTGAKTVNSTALPRYTDGVGVEAWVEITTATTTTAPVINMDYVDDSSTPRTSPNLTFPAAATVLRWCGELPLTAPSKGVLSVTNINVVTAASAGVCNVVLLKPLAYIPLLANIWNERDLVLQLSALPRVYDGASLALMFMASATTAPTVYGNIRLGYG